LESGGILIVGGGSLCCDSLEREESSFIGSGVAEQARESKRKVGNWSRNWTVSAFKVHWEDALEMYSRSSPYPYVLATLAHYGGGNISILLRSWFKDVVSHVGISL
jgi:hypothetical protein